MPILFAIIFCTNYYWTLIAGHKEYRTEIRPQHRKHDVDDGFKTLASPQLRRVAEELDHQPRSPENE